MPADGPLDARLPAPLRYAARRGTVVALVGFGLLLTEASLSGLFRRGPFSSDLFDAQAHALLGGHLDVDPAVAGIEGFVHGGRTQLYFGLVPAILRLPIAALTDGLDGRLTQISMLLALTVALWASARILWRARVWQRGDRAIGPWEPWIIGGFTAAVGLASPLLFLAARPVVYHETELWGVATTLVAIEMLLRWWDAPSRRSLVIASAAALVALNTRASVGGGAVAALALTAALAVLTCRLPRRSIPALVLAVLVPVMSYAGVNQARFGDPFRVPFREQVLSGFDPARQATLEATGGTLFGLEFAPTALLTYTRPDGVEMQRLFPWITFRESTRVVGDARFDTIDRAASLPVVAPTFVALGAVGLVALVRRGRRAPWLVATFGAALGLTSTLTIAFIANRYLADFVPALLLPATVGAWVVADWLGRHPGWRRRVAAVALVGASTASTAASTALAIQSQDLFILPRASARHALVELQYDLHERLFGGRPPGVQRAGSLQAPQPRGAVVVLDDCRGLYWSDAKRWWPLELGRRDAIAVVGTVGPGRQVLAAAETWQVVAEANRGDVVVSFEHRDGTRRVGATARRRDLDRRPVTLLLDRVNGELTVTASGHEVLVAWLVALDGDPVPGPGFVEQAVATPLCEELTRRLDRVG